MGHSCRRFAATSARWRALFGGVAVAGLLASCGGDGTGKSVVPVVSAPLLVTPTPTATPTSAPSPTATATPSPTPSPTETPNPSASASYSPPAATLAGVAVQAGDSIGFGTGNWAAFDHLELGNSVAVHNASVSGRTLLTGYQRRTEDLFVHFDPSRPSVLLIELGTNDLAITGTAGTPLYTEVLAQFVAAAHAAGFYVIVNTILPRADIYWNNAKEVERQVYNAAVRANTAKADAINDIAVDPVLGDAVDPATSAYFSDALHPDEAGQRRLAMIDAAVLAPFLKLGPRQQ